MSRVDIGCSFYFENIFIKITHTHHTDTYIQFIRVCINVIPMS